MHIEGGRKVRRRARIRRVPSRRPSVPGGAVGFFSGLNRRKFIWNLAAFILLAFGLQYAEKTRAGQEALDYGYDFLVRGNYKSAVIAGHETPPVSPDLRLVFFDARSYKQSYTKGYWTPRDELGLTILNAVRRRAKVVVTDFSFSGEAPVVLKDGQTLDGDLAYLKHLEEAGRLAREKKVSILVPTIEAGSRPPKGYLEILGRYRDVFRPANFKALRDGRDRLVRRFSWFDYSADYAPILSANLLATLLLRSDDASAQREAKAVLVGAGDSPKLLAPDLRRALHPENQKASSRIIFRILPREVVARNFGGGPDILKNVLWLPAQVNGPNQAEPDFSGQVVLIGSDFQENGDFHDTAFGPMSGSYILANSINMVLTGLFSREARTLNLMFLIVTGLLASFLYARFEPVGPTVFFFGLAALSPFLSVWVFNRYGLFFDVWLPALGIGLLNLAVERADLVFYFVKSRLPIKLMKRL